MVRVANRTIRAGLLNGSLDIDAATPGPITSLGVHHRIATQISTESTTEESPK